MEQSSPAPQPADRSTPGVSPSPTFRDPAGSLHLEGDLAVRTIHPAAREAALDFVRSPFYLSLVERGLVVASTIDETTCVTNGEPALRLLHPRIPVPTYPWEWTPSQWLAAADLTLTLCEEALDHGWILKDATPLNILFVGPRPILVDVLSFEPWPPAPRPTNLNPAPQIWLAYGQYMRTFILPLLMNRMLSWPLALSLFKRDGYEPADLYNALSWPQRLSRAALWPVTLPAILEKRGDQKSAQAAPPATPKPVTDPGLALHTLKRTLTGLRRMTHRAVPPVAASDWSDYKSTLTHYTAGESSDKHTWVAQVLTETRPSTPSSQQAWSVLDIGANTGEFSALAATSGASVVALERDAAAADRLFRLTRDKALAVQTVHSDLSRPTPAAGWLNSETSSLLDRLDARFDLVLMLAVIHHLLLMEQIPLPGILQLCHRLTRRHLVLEWVPPTDPMYISLMRGRTDLYGNLSEADLLAAASNLFRSLHRHPLANGRILFLFEKI
jgi:SAM-dependent methyltransferase